jgi:hypothetical protein
MFELHSTSVFLARMNAINDNKHKNKNNTRVIATMIQNQLRKLSKIRKQTKKINKINRKKIFYQHF